MVRGPQAERLTKAVTGGNAGAVNAAALEWEKCSGVLTGVGEYLKGASGSVKWAIGGETGPAVDAAFQKSAAAMDAKAKVLLKGNHALRHAGNAIQTAIDHEAKLEDMSAPTAYRAPGSNATDDELAHEAKSKAKEGAFADAFAAQEEKARAHADALDEALGKSSSTMKEIHGEPDPPPPPPPPASGPGRSGGSSAGVGHMSASTIGSHASDPGTAHTVLVEPKHPHHETPIDYVPNNTGGTGDDTPSVPGGTTFPGTPIGGAEIAGPGGSSGPGLGVLGATGGGAAAGLLGAKLTGALKGGLFPGSGGAAATAGRGTAASAVRGIGSSARSGGAGTLGRSGTAATAAGKSATSGTPGRSGAGATGRSGSGGRGGSGGRSGAGGRSGSGGRSGAGPTGRSGRGKDDEKGKQKELFDVGEEWVDDEGAAPGVLD